ncbi:MAG: histidinol-phosphate transaminase [Phycisphaerae bacterium]
MSWFRDNIDRMAAYVPGEQTGETGVVKLNTNENAYPPSPRVLEALAEFDPDLLRRYPDAMATRFRRAAAKVLDVDAEWILPGNGSDDLIMMIARACTGPKRRMAYPTPTFTFYRTQADIENAPAVEVPFDEDFALPLEELAEANAAVTFVANPNSPSGTAVPVEQLDELAQRLDGLLIVDEAYIDFAEPQFCSLKLPLQRENVVVLRTLSKGYSLAGLRLGFAVARPAILEGLLKTKAIYNVGAVPCLAGAAAMEDQDHKNANAEKICQARDKLSRRLEQMGFKVWPSQANFLMVRPTAGDAERLYRELKDRGVLVRYFAGAATADKLRFAVGTDEQNEALVAGLAALLSKE